MSTKGSLILACGASIRIARLGFLKQYWEPADRSGAAFIRILDNLNKDPQLGFHCNSPVGDPP